MLSAGPKIYLMVKYNDACEFFFGPIKIVKDIFVESPVYEAGLETTFFDLLSA